MIKVANKSSVLDKNGAQDSDNMKTFTLNFNLS